MNLVLSRPKDKFKDEGVFGQIEDERGNHLFYTLEHSYVENMPKLDEGVYTCKRGMHRLASSEKPFETFQIMNVPGHTGILFHVGNYERDSSGCVLIGLGIGKQKNGKDMLTYSRQAFQKFMDMLSEFDEFTLVVVDCN